MFAHPSRRPLLSNVSTLSVVSLLFLFNSLMSEGYAKLLSLFPVS